MLPTCRIVVWPLLILLGPVVGHHKSRIPREGGLIILVNHLSDFDPIVVQACCPRPIYFMAKSELFTMPILGRVIRSFKTFSVSRGEPDRKALRMAAQIAKRGEVVCIFPEGKLSDNGRLQELLPGVALIAKFASTPVICCGLTNTDRIIPYKSYVPRPAFCRVTAMWGEPQTFDASSEARDILDWAKSQLLELGAKENPISS